MPASQPYRSLLVAVFMLLALPAPGAQEDATRRPMTVDDALDMVDVRQPLLSPDGSWLLYEKRTLNWKKNEYDSEYWRVAADGSGAWRYIGEEGGSAFQFSPQGTYLTFRRKVGEGDDKSSQLFLMRTAGGEAVQLTKHASNVGAYQWKQDESAIVFEAADALGKDEKKERKNGADAIFVDEGPNGQGEERWENLWVFDMTSEEIRQVTDEDFMIRSWDLSRDGARIALTARYRNRRNDAYLDEIYVADVASGKLQRLTQNEAPEGDVRWSPDGSTILYAAADDEDWMNRNTKLWLIDPASGEHRLLTGAFEGSVGDAVWSADGRSALFAGQQGTATNLFSLHVASGHVEQLTQFDGTMGSPSFSSDGMRYAFTYSDYRTPTDIWVGDLTSRQATQVTHANPQVAGWQLAKMEIIQWSSRDDVTIEGLLHLPADHTPGERAPLMLNIHGGPAGVFANRWSARYHIYAGLGYASLSPNVRGSRSYSDALREGNTVQQGDGIGKGDYSDLMTGVDRLIEDGIADPEKLALRGWSYGGILGGWTITQTDRFKAASIGAGVYDWTSEYGPGFNNDVRLWHIGGTPWDNPDAWREQSALTHAANVTTPTLLIHGMKDTTDTEQQSMMFYAALRDIGKTDVRYIRFPREPHGFREPRHQRTRDIEEIRWMQRHVLGEEWTPWERPQTQEDEAEGTEDDQPASEEESEDGVTAD